MTTPFEDIQAAIQTLKDNGLDRHPPILVAPNKKVRRQWQKEYPGVEVVLRSQATPIDIKQATDLGLSSFHPNTND